MMHPTREKNLNNKICQFFALPCIFSVKTSAAIGGPVGLIQSAIRFFA